MRVRDHVDEMNGECLCNLCVWVLARRHECPLKPDWGFRWNGRLHRTEVVDIEALGVARDWLLENGHLKAPEER